MINIRSFFFAVLFLSTSTYSALSQMSETDFLERPSPPENIMDARDFVSPDGNATLTLPRFVNGFRKINPSAGIKGGSQFFWKMADGKFFLSYYDKESEVEDAHLELQSLSESMLADFIAKGGKLLSRKEIFLNKHPGMEVKILLKEGETALFRYYLVNDRVYGLSTKWNQTEDGAAQLKVLDSFKLTGKSRN